MNVNEFLIELSKIPTQTERWFKAMTFCKNNLLAPASQNEMFEVVGSGEYIDPYTKTIYIVSCVEEIRVSAVQVLETSKLFKLSTSVILRTQLNKIDEMKIHETAIRDSYFTYSQEIKNIQKMVDLIKERTIAQHKKLIARSESIIKKIETTDAQYINKNKFD